METFRLSQVQRITAEQLPAGNYIILLDANAVPPHLLVSAGDAVYGISASGRQLGSPLEKLLGYVQRKKIPALFVEWNLPPEQRESFRVLLHENFSRYTRVEAGKISCLFPIRDTAATLHGPGMTAARFIFELFPLMQQQNALGEAYGLQMEQALADDGSFALAEYDEDALRTAIVDATRLVS